MEKKFKLEPFDIVRAKAGEPVCTIDGEDVKILCFDRNNKFFPIVALVGYEEIMSSYSSEGKFLLSSENSEFDLMMKVEVKVKEKEPVIYAEVGGEIIPFEELKASGFIDLKTLNYIIIKTYDGKFLKIWKKSLPKREWEEAQKSATQIGKGWRCPTRHECIDICNARFKGLDEAMEDIKGESLKEIYWTSEVDLDPLYSATHAVYVNGNTGSLSTTNKFNQSTVRPVCEIK